MTEVLRWLLLFSDVNDWGKLVVHEQSNLLICLQLALFLIKSRVGPGNT